MKERKSMFRMTKMKSRLMAGFLAFVLVMSNIAANVQTVYAFGYPLVGRDGDETENTVTQSEKTPDLRVEIAPMWETDEETGELTWNGEWEPKEYPELGAELLEQAGLDSELTGHWSGDDDGVLEVMEDGSAYALARGTVNVTFVYETPDEKLTEESADAEGEQAGNETTGEAVESSSADESVGETTAAEETTGAEDTATGEAHDEETTVAEETTAAEETTGAGDTVNAEETAEAEDMTDAEETEAAGETVVEEASAEETASTEAHDEETTVAEETIAAETTAVEETIAAEETTAADTLDKETAVESLSSVEIAKETAEAMEETDAIEESTTVAAETDGAESNESDANVGVDDSVVTDGADGDEETSESESQQIDKGTPSDANQGGSSADGNGGLEDATKPSDGDLPEEGEEFTWVVEVVPDSAFVTIYSDEPYNDLMELPASEEYIGMVVEDLFGDEKLDEFGLPTGGKWWSSDEDVLAIDPETGAITFMTDDGACTIAYIYSEDGEPQIAMWDVTVGVGIAALNVTAQQHTSPGNKTYSYYPAPTGTGSAREPNTNDLKSDGTGEYKFVLPNSESKRLHLVSPFYLSSPRSSNGTVAMIYRLYNITDKKYVYVYCADAQTTAHGGSSSETAYRRDNLENSWFAGNKTQAQLNKLRAVVENSYPYITDITDIIDPMVDAGYTINGAVDLGQIISATQSAIWSITNGESRAFKKIVSTTNLDGNAKRGEKRFKTLPAEYNTNKDQVSNNIAQIQKYLLSRTASDSSPNVVIRSMTADYAGKGNSYTIRVGLNAKVTAGSDITVKIKKGSTSLGTKKLSTGEQYAVFENVNVTVGETITATLSGTQSVAKSVYYYTPKDRNNSQALIGVGKGSAPVSASKDIKIKDNKLTLELTKHEKLNGVTTKNPVQGAEFSLFRKGKKGSVDTLIASGLTSNAKGVVSYTFKVNDDATADEFYFVETKAPAGYDKADTTHYAPGSTVYNNKDVGKLTVKKTVKNGTGIADTNKLFQFKVTIGNDTYQFTLKHNESWTSPKDYPVGTRYTITEDSYSGYTASGLVNGKIVKGGSTASVTNTYDVQSTSTELNVNKTVDYTGYERPENQTFTFVLSGPSDVTYPSTTSVTTNGTANAKFSNIKFTKAGNYTFTITERSDNLPHYKYDTSVWTVNVSVKDDGNGNLYVDSKNYTKNRVRKADAASFTNTYQPRSTTYTPEVSKRVTGGHERPEDKSFTFTLTEDSNDNPKVLTSGMTTTVNVPAGSNVGPFKASFGELEFSKPGTYKFEIAENQGTETGYEYDKTKRTLTVVVTDDHNGALISKGEVAGGTGLEFTNSYQPETTTWAPSVTKNFNGDEDPERVNRQFTFDLSLTSGDANSVTIPDPQAVVNSANGWKDTFGAVTFKKAGTYTFHIKEKDPNLAGYADGLAEEQNITVVVKDENGKLKAYADDGTSELVSGFTFTNTFDFIKTNWTPSVNKTIESNGHEIPAGYEKTFSFTMGQDASDAIKVTISQPTVTIAKPYNSTPDFGEITFEKPGTYHFTVREDAPGSGERTIGYTYDNAVYNVTVEVTSDNEGRLGKTVTVTKTVDGSMTSVPSTSGDTYTFNFTNTYQPETTTWAPSVTKNFNGDEDPEKVNRLFTFDLSLTSGDANSVTIPDAQAVVNNTNEWTDTFGAVTFKKAGTYTFQIEEENPYLEGYASGLAEAQDVTVVVIDENGELKAYATEAKEPLVFGFTFINTFDFVDTTWQPQVRKVMETNDHEIPENYRKDFSFTLTQNASDQRKVLEEDDTATISFPEGVATSFTSTAKFNEITFTQPGDYHFTIAEAHGAEDPTGYAYDKAVYKVTVKVTYDDVGTLSKAVTVSKTNGRFTASSSATVDDTYAFEFTNTYKPVATAVTLNANKRIESPDEQGGYTNPNDVTFSFVLEDLLASDGRFSTGRAIETKTITLNPNADALGVSVGTTEGTVSFSEIKYEKAGTYKYLIREEIGDVDGFSYDSTVWTVTVEVTDKDGKLIPEVTYTPSAGTESTANGEAAEFVNRYDTTKAYYKPQVFKTIEGSTTALDKKFTFNLETVLGQDGRFTMGSVLDTVELELKAGETFGNTSFKNIEYTKPGTYKYLIKEVKPENADEDYKGYTFDETVWTLTVEVVDTGSALKVNSVKYEASGKKDESIAAKFTNRYTVTETKLNAGILKQVSGAPIPAGQTYEFLFEISQDGGQDGAELPEKREISVVVSSDEGSANRGSFDDITFKKAGTFNFTIAEVDNGIPGYTYDKAPYEVTVNVVDKDSQLTVDSVEFTRDGQPVVVNPMLNEIDNTEQFETVFTNTYDYGDTSYSPNVRKVITGESRPDDNKKEFTFTIEETGYTPPSYALGLSMDNVIVMPANTTISVTDEGTASFEEITFNAPGTYTFTIKENSGTENGYTYDETVWNLTVEIVDKNGKLEVDSHTYTSNGPDSSYSSWGAAFTNDYEVQPTTFAPEVKKTVKGEFLWDEVFNFELRPADTNPEGAELRNTEDATKVSVNAQSVSQGNGTVKFADIDFKKAGTYEFIITETEGVSPYWTNDDRSWTLTVEVVDNDSVLEVKSHSYRSNRSESDTNDGSAEFENAFTTPGELTISKTVSGNRGERTRDFNFTVTLTDAQGQQLTGNYSYVGSSIDGVEAPADGTVENGVLNVTLKHGQQITIHDLPAGTKYTVTETEADADGYRTTVEVNGTSQTEDEAAGWVAEGAVTVVEYLNYRNRSGGNTPGGPGPGPGPGPEGPGDNPGPEFELITDEPTPLGSLTNIEDEDVPLAFLAPATGDEKPVGAAALFGLLALGMMGAFGILAFKKDKDEA